jgi:hypothetical protein
MLHRSLLLPFLCYAASCQRGSRTKDYEVHLSLEMVEFKFGYTYTTLSLTIIRVWQQAVLVY